MNQILSFPREVCAAAAFDDRGAQAAIARLFDGGDLDRDASRDLFARIVDGSLGDPLMAAAFVALRIKGETSEELTGAALALRDAARPFPAPSCLFADSCGTGGDFSGSINVSTAALRNRRRFFGVDQCVDCGGDRRRRLRPSGG